jgi:hypothetical protein
VCDPRVTRTGTVEIVADLLVVCRDRLGNRAGAADDKEPARDFLSGTDFGEGTEGGWIEVHGERFLVVSNFSAEGIATLQSSGLMKKHDLNLTPSCARSSSS